MTVQLSYRDDVALLSLGDDENRFSLEWLDHVDSALDRVVAGPPTALVTVAEGRFYTNGLDLEWLGAHLEQYEAYLGRVERLLGRVLTLPVPTVAAVVGHAFGAGAMLALAHDFRVMREDRGYVCLPEVDLGLPFSPGMAALVQAKLTPQAAVAAMTTGRRFDGPSSRTAGLVDDTAAADELVDRACAVAAPLVGKDPATLGGIKWTMFGHAAELLGHEAGRATGAA